jgi:hypothetical protein
VSSSTPSSIEEYYERLQPQGGRRDEVVPAVRQHSTKALRVASVKLTELADYMEQQKTSQK